MPRNKPLKEILGENVRAIMKGKNLSQPQIAALAKQAGYKIDQTTIGRIARAAMPTTVDSLDALAGAANLEPWQLLVPGLDPLKPPKLGASDEDRESLEKIRRIVAETQVVEYSEGQNKNVATDAGIKRRTS